MIKVCDSDCGSHADVRRDGEASPMTSGVVGWTLGVPSGRRVFTDQSVDGLAEQVGVPGVPPVLLNQAPR
jgi:hypothetical protein